MMYYLTPLPALVAVDGEDASQVNFLDIVGN